MTRLKCTENYNIKHTNILHQLSVWIRNILFCVIFFHIFQMFYKEEALFLYSGIKTLL